MIVACSALYPMPNTEGLLSLRVTIICSITGTTHSPSRESVSGRIWRFGNSRRSSAAGMRGYISVFLRRSGRSLDGRIDWLEDGSEVERRIETANGFGQ